MKKVAILTSGGDAPGMNNAIRAIVKTASMYNIEAYLVKEGFKGLYEANIQLSKNNNNIDKYISRGGTFIHSMRFPQFKNVEIRKKAIQNLNQLGIDALVVIGGDGTYQGAQKLHDMGVKTIALPGTIDNDITSSDTTIGYDTALNTIVRAVDKIRDTAESHSRCIIVEVMGNGCGDLTLFGAIATGAEVVVTNTAKKTPEEIAQIVKKQSEKEKRAIIVLVSEKIFSNLHELAQIVEAKSGKTTRFVSLGHIQRGGSPTARERINATLMGIKAIELLLQDKSGLAIGNINGQIKSIPILEALSLPRDDKQELTAKINSLNQK